MGKVSLKKLSLGQKLYGGFGVVLAITAALGIVVLLSMSSMNRQSANVTGSTFKSISAVDDMTTTINVLVRHQREHLGVTSADKANLAKEIKADEAHFVAQEAIFASLAATPTERKEMARVRSLYGKYLAKTASFVRLSDADKVAQGMALLASSAGYGAARERRRHLLRDRGHPRGGRGVA